MWLAGFCVILWPCLGGRSFANHGCKQSRCRPGFGAAAMRTAIAFLASITLSANATAASTQYAVDGLALGTRLNFDSGSYREYKCSPSDQFDGLTWCQKTRTDRERRGSYTAAYSILHSREGNVLYVNRSQEPAFFKRTSRTIPIIFAKVADPVGGGCH
jgi:hypothetical protein